MTDWKERAEAAEAQVAALRNERDMLRETLAESDLGAQVLSQWEAIAAADADRDRLEAQVAALQRELAEARRRECTALCGDVERERDELAAERDAVVAAVRTAQITHIREWHPNYAHVGVCSGCQALVPLSRDLPSRPDVPEEIRRLAQATTESTEEATDAEA